MAFSFLVLFGVDSIIKKQRAYVFPFSIFDYFVAHKPKHGKHSGL
jgi:hypothetical protein